MPCGSTVPVTVAVLWVTLLAAPVVALGGPGRDGGRRDEQGQDEDGGAHRPARHEGVAELRCG